MNVRIYSRNGYFWAQWYQGKKQFRKSLELKVDLKEPESIRENPDWWKKSKYRKTIKEHIDAIVDKALLGVSYEVQRPVEPPDILRLLDLFNHDNARESYEKTAKTLTHRQDAVKALLKFDPSVRLRGVSIDYAIRWKDWALKKGRGDKGYAQATVRGYVVEFRQLWNYAIREGFLHENYGHRTINPWKEISVKVAEKHYDPVGEELMELLRFMYPRNFHMANELIILRLTGIRVSDLVALRWENVRLGPEPSLKYYNEKKQRWEIIPISDALAYHFSMMPQQEDGYVAHYRSVSTIGHYLKAACILGGYTVIKPHDLKREFIHDLDLMGVPDRVVTLAAHHSPRGETATIQRHYSRNAAAIKEAVDKAHRNWLKFLKELHRMKKGDPINLYAEHRATLADTRQ